MSGLQKDVLALYRKVLRVVKAKDLNLKDKKTTLDFAKKEFRKRAKTVGRSDFRMIEFCLRDGHKRLRLLEMPNVKTAYGWERKEKPK